MTLVNKVLKTATVGYVVFAMVVWALDYFQIDVTPIIEWLGLPPDFLGATGIASGIGLTVYQVLRTAQLSLQQNTQQAVSNVNTTVLGVLEKMTTIQADTQVRNQTTEQQLKKANALLYSIIEFEKLLAEKNKQSRLLSDESKHELDVWVKTTELRLRELDNETV